MGVCVVCDGYVCVCVCMLCVMGVCVCWVHAPPSAAWFPGEALVLLKFGQETVPHGHLVWRLCPRPCLPYILDGGQVVRPALLTCHSLALDLAPWDLPLRLV